MKKLTLQEWRNKANEIHNFKYDYSKSIYECSRSYIEIICIKHGSFLQTANSHLNGRGCPFCVSTAPIDLNTYFDRFYKKHGSKYNYSKSIIINDRIKIIIICPIHGEFIQAPKQHFKQGCAACANVKKLSLEDFIARSKIIHGNQYDYSESVYLPRPEKIKIICKRHGSFYQTSNAHLSGKGCVKCTSSISKKETKWLNYLKVPKDNLHRNVIFSINDKRFNVDGYFGNDKIIYEFLGDYWHGNPKVYCHSDFNKRSKKTFGQLFKETNSKLSYLKDNGFQIITIWESEYDLLVKNKEIL